MTTMQFNTQNEVLISGRLKELEFKVKNLYSTYSNESADFNFMFSFLTLVVFSH